MVLQWTVPNLVEHMIRPNSYVKFHFKNNIFMKNDFALAYVYTFYLRKPTKKLPQQKDEEHVFGHRCPQASCVTQGLPQLVTADS